jgi:hypothetical protein
MTSLADAYRISICAKDIEPVKYTKYVDECCRVIEEANEYPGDVYLVQLVRIQCLADKIRRTLGQDEWDWSGGISTPIGACVKSLEGELQSLRASLTLDGPYTGTSIRGIFL